MKKSLTVLLTLALALGLLSGCASTETAAETAAPTAATASAGLRFASSYDEVYQALKAAQDSELVRVSEASTATDGTSAEIQGATDDGTYVSGTNVQVDGVDEGDIVKTDGSYIYILRECELIVMQVDGATVTDISHTMVGQAWDSTELADGRTHTSEKTPTELYLCDGRAVVLSTYYDWTEGDADTVVEVDMVFSGSNYVTVDIYDMSDPAAPALVKSLGQDGYSVASRMIGSTLYLCTAYYPSAAQEGEEETFAPRVYTDGTAETVACGTIGLLSTEDSMTYSVLGCYDVASASLLGSQSVLGGGETVYMNTENLYLCRSVYSDEAGEPYDESPYTVTAHTTSVRTTVLRYAVSAGGLSYAAAGTVPGALLNQFSLDESGGYLRLVTTESNGGYRVYVDDAHDFENYDYDDTQTQNDLYVLDAELRVAGSVTGLAAGETIYSARFDGDYGYLCTYRTVDPIFALNLSDPANPTVTGELELPGYSDYLHVWSDGLLFGLGMSTQEVTADGETTAVVNGMKMVMIDTSDPAKLTAQSSMDIDADYSEALSNHKAILVDSEKNLIAFPAEGSYLIYRYSEADGFQLEKEISVTEWDWSNRGLYIGDYFYVVGSDYVNVLDLTTLENVSQTLIYRG